MVLFDSGRWVETLVRVGKGDRHILVAGFYGISGASLDGPKHIANERLIGYAIKRMMGFRHTPYFLAGDFNVDPASSETIQRAIDEQEVIDVFAARAPDAQAIHPTFASGGVFQGMTGPGKTRIDTVLCNQVANALVIEASLRWQLGMEFDHACLAVRLDLKAMTQRVQRLAPVIPVSLQGFFFDPPPKATADEKDLCKKLADEDFDRLWMHFDNSFAKALADKDVDQAHQIWCSASEIWLALSQPGDCDLKRLCGEGCRP